MSTHSTVNGVNATKQVIIYLDEKTDWILILHNKYFDNKNSLYFSIKWLSCDTVSIKNFYKDLNKKVFYFAKQKTKQNNILMMSVPSDDIVLSSFKRITVWNLANSSCNQTLEKVLSRSILSNYFKSKYENNYFFYNREDNIFVKISQNVSDNFYYLEYYLYLR